MPLYFIFILFANQITENEGSGLILFDSNFSASDCHLNKNGRNAVNTYGTCVVALNHCALGDNLSEPGVCAFEYDDSETIERESHIYFRNLYTEKVNFALLRYCAQLYTSIQNSLRADFLFVCTATPEFFSTASGFFQLEELYPFCLKR